MSTAPVVAAPTKGKSLLQKIGSDIKSVFAWLGSSNGQAVIASGEGIVEAIDPALTGVIALANTWLVEIIKSEALATAAAAQNGSGTQKAASVINSLTPEVLAFAVQNKLPTPTATQIQNASNYLVAFLNELKA